MLRRIERFFRSVGARGPVLRARLLLAWRWLAGEARDVQMAAIVMLVNILVGYVLAVVFRSHVIPACSIVIGYLIHCYFQRKVAIPVWLLELGAVLWRRGSGLLPDWLEERVGPGQSLSDPPHGGESSTSQIWHETSVGGNIFHINATVSMWAHVLLLAAVIFPVWEGVAYYGVPVITVYILYLVETEDFVNIKVWRRRLAYGLFAYGVYLIGPLALRTVAPGTYAYVASRIGYTQTQHQQTANGINTRTGANRWWLEKLDADELALLNKQRWYQLDPVNHAFTDEDQRQLDSVQEIKADLQPEEEVVGSSKSWSTSVASFPQEHPGWLIVLGLLFLARSKKSAGHHGHEG